MSLTLCPLVAPNGDLQIFTEHVSVVVCHKFMSAHAPIFGHIWTDRRNKSVPMAKVLIRQTATELVNYVNYTYGLLRFVLLYPIIPLLTNGYSVNFTGRLDYRLLDNLYAMSRAFSDVRLSTLITTEILRRFPSTLSAWCDRSATKEGLGDGGCGDLETILDAFTFVKKYRFEAAVPAAFYDICQHFSMVSGSMTASN